MVGQEASTLLEKWNLPSADSFPCKMLCVSYLMPPESWESFWTQFYKLFLDIDTAYLDATGCQDNSTPKDLR